MTPTQIAAIAHAANRAYCQAIGDNSLVEWGLTPVPIQQGTEKGVIFFLDNPNSGPADMHANWVKDKVEAGWTYGPAKDATAKTHPCIVPYDLLPELQRAKDRIFIGVVRAFIPPEAMPSKQSEWENWIQRLASGREHLRLDIHNDELVAISKEVTDLEIKCDKQLRKDLDEVLQRLKQLKPSRHRALSITHLEDSIMRLGMDLKEIGAPNPYPNSYKPTNTVVDPTADGLKL